MRCNRNTKLIRRQSKKFASLLGSMKKDSTNTTRSPSLHSALKTPFRLEQRVRFVVAGR
jgi:hypothetical protein